ncbi:DNA ligase [Thalassotalea euphylliae]|uniref:DNA ligase n=1 Tax=Thalassotalea euphylliae TaxID=1655234 RepID=UPI003637AF62
MEVSKHLSRIAALFLLLYLPTAFALNSNPLFLQLAKKYQPGVDVRDYWVSEKLDGVRGYWDGTTMYTKRGRTITLPAFFTKDWPKSPLEGELWIDRGKFEQVSAVVRKKYAKDFEWQSIKFMLFDVPRHPGNFTERINVMKATVLQANNRHLQMIEQYRVKDNALLDSWLLATVEAGGEGLMLHKANALYEVGRTNNIVKLKPFFDAEAQVIAHLPGKGKYTDKMGALVVQNSDGYTFKIGSGFNDNERINPPPIGSIITYKYSGKTSKGVPRFASFLRIRHLAKVD